jgi:hypothetical protein
MTDFASHVSRVVASPGGYSTACVAVHPLPDEEEGAQFTTTVSVGLDPDRLDVQVLFHVLYAGLAAVSAHLVAERYRRVAAFISGPLVDCDL